MSKHWRSTALAAIGGVAIVAGVYGARSMPVTTVPAVPAAPTATTTVAQPPLSDADIALVRRIAGQQMSKAGVVRVAKVTGANVIDAYMPGEQPWGDSTAQVAADDILVVEVNGANVAQVPMLGPSPSASELPALGLVIFIDVRLGDSVGGWGSSKQESLTKATLTPLHLKVPSAAIVDVSVPVSSVVR